MRMRSPSAKDLQIACMALQGCCPTLSPETLVEALRAYPEDSQGQSAPAREEFLTVGEVARDLHVSTATVWRMLRDGLLPRVRVGRGSTRIPASAMATLVAGGLKNG